MLQLLLPKVLGLTQGPVVGASTHSFVTGSQLSELKNAPPQCPKPAHASPFAAGALQMSPESSAPITQTNPVTQPAGSQGSPRAAGG